MGASMDASLRPETRLRLALDLFEAGVDLMRQNLRRAHPSASREQLDALLAEWLRTRPGAEHGDVAGAIRLRVDPPT